MLIKNCKGEGGEGGKGGGWGEGREREEEEEDTTLCSLVHLALERLLFVTLWKKTTGAESSFSIPFSSMSWPRTVVWNKFRFVPRFADVTAVTDSKGNHSNSCEKRGCQEEGNVLLRITKIEFATLSFFFLFSLLFFFFFFSSFGWRKEKRKEGKKTKERVPGTDFRSSLQPSENDCGRGYWSNEREK